MEKEIHTVGLGEVRKVAPRNRASKGMKLLKEYVRTHTGIEDVSVSNAVNEALWSEGASNPPRSIDIQIAVEESTAYIEMSELEMEIEEEEEVLEEISDEELAEKNVDEVKALVEEGAVEAQRALDIEYAGKNRKTLIEWLEERTAGEEDVYDEAVDEYEDLEESGEDGADEASQEDTDEDDEGGSETYDLPDNVIATFQDGNIGEGKEAAKELGKDAFEKLLNVEEENQDRKGMKKWLRSNMN